MVVLGAEEEGDVGGEVGVAVVRAVAEELSGHGVRGGDSSFLHGCGKTETKFI